jgi:hypothetical protein
MKRKPAKPMKPLPVIFISKEGMATFWFCVGVAAMLASAFYVERTARTAGKSAQFIIMTNPDVVTIPAERNFDPDKMHEIYLSQTRLVMDSVFNKAPAGLDNPDRCKRLLTVPAWENVKATILEPQSDAFRQGNIHQKVEIQTLDFKDMGNNEVQADVTAQLIRTGSLKSEMFNEVWSVRAIMVWQRNGCLRDCARFPIVCSSFGSVEKPVSSTLRYTSASDASPSPATTSN